MAARVEAIGSDAAAKGRQLTAGNYYIRAGNYYFTADRPVPPSERKLDLYRNALRCFHAGFDRRYPQMERVDVPYEGAALPRISCRRKAQAAGRRPWSCSTAWTTARR